MMESNVEGQAVNQHANHAIQFYSIELTPLYDGRLSVGVMATLCEADGDLEGMDLGSHRVGSLDEALAVIRDAVITA
jgi:hypothetical protein